MTFNFGSKIKSIAQHKAAVGLIAGAFIITTTTTTVYAANNAAPGDWLYGLDRAIERIQEVFTFGKANKVKLKAKLLEERIEELDKLATEKKDPALIKEQLEQIKQLTQQLREEIKHLKPREKVEIAHQIKVAMQELRDTAGELQKSYPKVAEKLAQLRQNIARKASENYPLRKRPLKRNAPRRVLERIKQSPKAPELSNDIKEQLKHLREEEKLARDVYLALFDKWQDRVFRNIAQAEQRHMDAVKILLDKYNIPDPVKGAGVFSDKKLQELYTKLVEQGSKSLEDALKVGATIEDLDIAELNKAIKSAEKYQDIKEVYELLKRGSENHMRAFVGRLRQLGQEYKPAYISENEFRRIVNQTPKLRQRGPQRTHRQGRYLNRKAPHLEEKHEENSGRHGFDRWH